ncbi:MAG: hypothetical protein WA058_02230 [Minisyncoccia bacterium]
MNSIERKMYWKGFGITFAAWFLMLNTLGLPAVYGVLSGAHFFIGGSAPGPHLIQVQIFGILICLWEAWSSVMKCTTKNGTPERQQQLEHDVERAKYLFLHFSPVGWLVLLWRKLNTNKQ